MTYSTIAGMLIPDLILGKENPWKDIYEPSRKTFKAIPKFLNEQLNASMQYMDWFTKRKKEIIKKLPLGEGIIKGVN